MILLPPLLMSPMYLELLSQALKRSKKPLQEARDFTAFLNDLKFELRANGNQRMVDFLVAEELSMAKQLGVIE